MLDRRRRDTGVQNKVCVLIRASFGIRHKIENILILYFTQFMVVYVLVGRGSMCGTVAAHLDCEQRSSTSLSTQLLREMAEQFTGSR